MAIARTVDRRLFFMLDRAHLQVAASADRVLKSIPIGRAQAAVLVYLGYHDGCSLTELAEGTGRGNAAISGLIGRMIDAGLIERRASYGDRRTRTVHLSDAGWVTREEVMNAYRDFNTQLSRGLSDAELAAVLKFLALSAENVG